MHRIEPLRTTFFLLLFLAILSFAGVPAVLAQDHLSSPDVISDGEPTDPEGALALLRENGIDPGGYDVNPTSPQAEEEVSSWFEALLNLLRNLGLITPEEPGS